MSATATARATLVPTDDNSLAYRRAGGRAADTHLLGVIHANAETLMALGEPYPEPLEVVRDQLLAEHDRLVHVAAIATEAAALARAAAGLTSRAAHCLDTDPEKSRLRRHLAEKKRRACTDLLDAMTGHRPGPDVCDHVRAVLDAHPID